MVAGAGLNNRATVEFVVENAPRAIERLAELGVPFNAGEDERWHLTREGGHSHRRIVHVDDATGWAVQQALRSAPPRPIPTSPWCPTWSRSTSSPAATASAIRATAMSGASMRSTAATGRVETVHRPRDDPRHRRRGPRPISIRPRRAARPATASPWRGAPAAASPTWSSMQFHPTCLYNLEVKNFLITEAVRGEGGQLKTARHRPPLHARFRPARRARAARHRRPRDRP